MLSKYKGNTSWVVIVAAVPIGMIMDTLPDGLFIPFFCDLPAFFASKYYQAHLARPELVFSVRDITVQVTRGCGASGFFAICAALLLTRLWQCYDVATGGSAWKAAVAALFAVAVSWILTLVINCARIVCLIPVTEVTLFLPEKFRASVHMMAGMVILMGAFIALWAGSGYIINERRRNEHSRQRDIRN